MIDEDLVETSDAEELAQLEKERDDLEVSSSPLRGRQDHSPRKRIKVRFLAFYPLIFGADIPLSQLFHEGEKISSRSGPHQSSSPLPGRQSIRSTVCVLHIYSWKTGIYPLCKANQTRRICP